MTSKLSSRPLRGALERIEKVPSVVVKGRVLSVVGPIVRAALRGGRIGDLVSIARDNERSKPLLAEVVGFREEQALLMPFGSVVGISSESLVERCDRPLSVPINLSLLGRVLNGLGEPIDGKPFVDDSSLPDSAPWVAWPIERSSPLALSRPPISRRLVTGVRAIDGLITIGEGQRVGLFAGAGVGKSTLLGQLARNASVDCCVVCLVGERGRELTEFINEALGPDGLARSTIVCATSDMSPIERMKSAHVATAIAEYYREQGMHVLLLMDSITRYARALREIGLAAGELPARRGYPPSVFAALPRLLERTGTSEKGLITAVYTVLVEGGDMEEPIADEVRGILDGHVVLTRKLGQRNHWPAIDVGQSVSRLMGRVASEEQRTLAAKLRELIAVYEEKRDLISLGAYRKGSDARVDNAVSRIDRVWSFLRQSADDNYSFEETMEKLRGIFAD